MNILVVGAGFAGATAARLLAEAGHEVLVIDKRDHIAGNAYDYVNEHGIRVHKYGPHLWHTSNDEVQEWASRFTEWVSYEHYVEALLPDGRYTPLPINNYTIEDVFEDEFMDWCIQNGFDYSNDNDFVLPGAHEAFLNSLLIKPEGDITNSEQHVLSSVGRRLCDLFFAPYTKKMWGLGLDELPAAVASRIPTSVGSYDGRYFPKDKHQVLPKRGYTKMIENILDHPLISVQLRTTRQQFMDPFLSVHWQQKTGFCPTEFDHIFTSEPIDTYFDCSLGELPWRSIKMHTYTVPVPSLLPAPVVNFTHNGPHTRVTEWKHLPGHGENPYVTTLTVEEPMDYRDNNMERYYPVRTSQKDCPHRALYRKYRDMAQALENVTFIGRCGRYVYTDMAPCIASTMSQVRKFLNGEKQTYDEA